MKPTFRPVVFFRATNLNYDIANLLVRIKKDNLSMKAGLKVSSLQRFHHIFRFSDVCVDESSFALNGL